MEAVSSMKVVFSGDKRCIVLLDIDTEELFDILASGVFCDWGSWKAIHKISNGDAL